MKRGSLVLILSLMVWGCSRTPTDTNLETGIHPTNQLSVPAPYGDKSTGVVQAVTGSGQLHTSTNGEWRTFTVHGVKTGDGAVVGGFEWRVHLGKTGSKIKGRVVCFTIADNQAWVAVIFEKAENPANIGKWASIRIADNGEGAGSAPDELGIRWQAFPGDGNDPEDFCVGQPTDQPLSPLEAGNLQIHR